MKTLDLKLTLEKLDIKPVDLGNFRDRPPILSEFNPEKLRSGDIIINNVIRDSEFAWMFLKNADARKHLNEFEKNPNLTNYVTSGKDVFVTPERTQDIYGIFGRPKSSVIKTGDSYKFDKDKCTIKCVLRFPWFNPDECPDIQRFFKEYEDFKKYK